MGEDPPSLEHEPVSERPPPAPTAVRVIAGVAAGILIIPAGIFVVIGFLDAFDLHIWSHLLFGFLISALVLFLGRISGLQIFPRLK